MPLYKMTIFEAGIGLASVTAALGVLSVVVSTLLLLISSLYFCRYFMNNAEILV